MPVSRNGAEGKDGTAPGACAVRGVPRCQGCTVVPYLVVPRGTAPRAPVLFSTRDRPRSSAMDSSLQGSGRVVVHGAEARGPLSGFVQLAVLVGGDPRRGTRPPGVTGVWRGGAGRCSSLRSLRV